MAERVVWDGGEEVKGEALAVTDEQAREMAAVLGRRGGKSRSAAKVAGSRANLAKAREGRHGAAGE